MIPKFRYRRTEKGIVVEYLHRNFWGKESWRIYIHDPYNKQQPKYYEDSFTAEMNIKEKVHNSALWNSKVEH